MVAFDLTAARAQRLEAKGAAFDFVVDGEAFSLPSEMPVDILSEIRSLEETGDLKGIVAKLMGDAAAADRLFAHKLSVQDVTALMDEWRKVTGAGVGEGSPSVS